jgi:hypothetical protein
VTGIHYVIGRNSLNQRRRVFVFFDPVKKGIIKIDLSGYFEAALRVVGLCMKHVFTSKKFHDKQILG